MSTKIKGTYCDNIKELRQSMGKNTEDPVIEMLSKKEMDAERTITAEVTVPSQDVGTISDNAKYVYACLLSKGKMFTYEVQHEAGLSKYKTWEALTELCKAGYADFKEHKSRGNPKSYWVTDKPVPKDWGTLEDIRATPRPVSEPVVRTAVSGAKKGKDPSKNALTKMLEKDISIPQDTEESYRRFLMDLQMLHYGVGEIDGLLNEIVKVIYRRLDNITYECPLCKGKIQRNITEARCTNPRCGIKIDAGDFNKSMKVMALMKDHSGEL